MKFVIKYSVLFWIIICNSVFAQSVKLNEKDAVVWHYEQEVTGELSGFETDKITIHLGDSVFKSSITHNTFSLQVTLREKETEIWVEVPYNHTTIISDTLLYTLGYDPIPIVRPIAHVKGDTAVLKAELIDNPYGQPVKYLWMPDSLNPAKSQIRSTRQSTAKVQIPDKAGHYYFNLFAVSGTDTTRLRTRVTRTAQKLHAFDMNTEVPYWMSRAIIYEITPYSFVQNGTFQSIKEKLPELKKLGINTIWLQPITKSSYRGQGYDVVDYLSVNPDLGTEKQLHDLIKTAKALDLRVLFDVVLNHTSIQHPYAQDAIVYGPASHYYDFYQREIDGKPYSSYYNQGEYGFINYFWKDLVNLNYQNDEVQRWMLEVCKYWVRKYDIDGYRFDAIWGVNARQPSFAQKLRTELKSINPDILLLAEDKGSVPQVFELGFDAAYDWTVDTSWVSQWSWEYEYNHEKNLTIFNFPDVNERGGMLRQALFNNRGHDHRILRYMGNNDLPHFIQDHSLEQTKMVASLLFSLPGIPMLYNGQEIGKRGHPYSIASVFHRDSTIKSLDDKGLLNYYQTLIQMRKEYKALVDGNMREVPVRPEESLVAFRRWKEGENFIVITNMDSTYTAAYVNLHDVGDIGSQPEEYQLRDIVSGDTFSFKEEISQLTIGMKKYSTRWLLLEKKNKQSVGIY